MYVFMFVRSFVRMGLCMYTNIHTHTYVQTMDIVV